MCSGHMPALPHELRIWPGNSPIPGWRENDGKKFIRVADKGGFLKVLDQLLLPLMTIVIVTCKYNQFVTKIQIRLGDLYGDQIRKTAPESSHGQFRKPSENPKSSTCNYGAASQPCKLHLLW